MFIALNESVSYNQRMVIKICISDISTTYNHTYRGLGDSEAHVDPNYQQKRVHNDKTSGVKKKNVFPSIAATQWGSKKPGNDV